MESSPTINNSVLSILIMFLCALKYDLVTHTTY